MIKYVDVMETFLEVPDEISLAINISNCPHKCPGCHSAYLQNDIGTELTFDVLNNLIKQHKGITCVAFLGGDNDVIYLCNLSKFVKDNYPDIKTCWYTGYDDLNKFIPDNVSNYFDYIKIGSYKEKFGPLTSNTTNQKFLKKYLDNWIDITYKFQINGNNSEIL